MQNHYTDPAAPEWASRFLKIPEFAGIVREDNSTVYRKINAGIYPQIIHVNKSARLAGWECWEVIKARMAARDDAA